MKTPQPLHIFRKDITHIWPEVLVSIALMAGFAWAESMVWSPVANADSARKISDFDGSSRGSRHLPVSHTHAVSTTMMTIVRISVA